MIAELAQTELWEGIFWGQVSDLTHHSSTRASHVPTTQQVYLFGEQIKPQKLISSTSYNQSFTKITLNNSFSLQELIRVD